MHTDTYIHTCTLLRVQVRRMGLATSIHTEAALYHTAYISRKQTQSHASNNNTHICHICTHVPLFPNPRAPVPASACAVYSRHLSPSEWADPPPSSCVCGQCVCVRVCTCAVNMCAYVCARVWSICVRTCAHRSMSGSTLLLYAWTNVCMCVCISNVRDSASGSRPMLLYVRTDVRMHEYHMYVIQRILMPNARVMAT